MRKILCLFLILGIICPLDLLSEEVQKTSKIEEVKGFTMTLVDKDGTEKAIVNGSTANILPGGTIEIVDVVSRVFDRDNIGGDTLIHSSRGIYNRLQNVVDTNQFVRINRRDMVITGTGLHWEPDKEEMEIHRNVKVEYTSKRKSENSKADITESSTVDTPSLKSTQHKGTNPEVKSTEQAQGQNNNLKEESMVTVITAEGSGKLNYKWGIVAIFRENVELDDKNTDMKAHLMKMFFDKETEALTKVEAYGNVKIKQPKRKSFCRKAVYFVDDDKIILTGGPKIVQGSDLYTAKKITIYNKGEKAVFEPRAELVFYSSTEREEIEKEPEPLPDQQAGTSKLDQEPE